MINLKNNVLKILIIMLTIIALLVPAVSYASDSSGNVILPGTTSNTTPSPTTSTKPTTSPTAKTTATPTNNSNLPQTGIEDYTGLIVAIVLLSGSAVFAYKKIKDYDRL